MPDLTHHIQISGSKSETNRLLVLKALYPEISIENCSNADDSLLMKQSLKQNKGLVNVYHAGTAMRFLTAYYACTPSTNVILTGSLRMKERPIKVLVDALRTLGASIEYVENEGFPPLKIVGKKIIKNQVTIDGSISSQYISALMLIAPSLESGLVINIQKLTTSLPYIMMTLQLLEKSGIECSFQDFKIQIKPTYKLKKIHFTVESDWSSASYWYSFIALSEIGEFVKLSSYSKNSLQGDSILSEIYSDFGVHTEFEKGAIKLIKISQPNISNFKRNLNSSPDIAQTIAVSCLGLQIPCELSGLHTLKIKETNRLEAMRVELSKFNANVKLTDESILIDEYKPVSKTIIVVKTYNDHRMAMAFAPIKIKYPIQIQNPEVVSKSYPNFWKDIKQWKPELF